jgi:hypothetical protein
MSWPSRRDGIHAQTVDWDGLDLWVDATASYANNILARFSRA